MKWRIAVAAACLLTVPVVALDGQPGLHDPSTVIAENGKYYVYATGGGLPMSISDDGWTWRRAGGVMAAVPGGKPGPDVIARGGNNTWAPDVIRVGGRYFLYYSAPGTQPKSAIGLLVGTTLDPDSPDYAWEDAGPVVWSDGVEDSNAIDPGVFRDPTNGTLWLTYGSYFGYIRLVELDPKTGKRLYPDRKPLNVAINSEASIMIFRDGWYYLLVTHGSCCAGANSSYNIRMGRAKKVTGPFLDNMGIDMLQGGGRLFLGSGGRYVGPGHFGRLDLGDGVEKFSCHYEADLDRGGLSVLDIRPLLWHDGWPVAGENVKGGTYVIESARTGTALEFAVQGVPVGGPRGRGGRGGPGAGGPPPPTPIPPQEASQVSTNWPAGPGDARLAPYMLQAQQQWTIAPASNAGGYPGSPFFKITIAGTDRTLAATEERELVVLPAFTGAPEQLWRIDQLADGTYRLMPKAVPKSGESLVLSAVGSSMPTLARFNPKSDRQRWNLRAP
jgi:arabinan endo-1,5-alpha-L-arabinosidase